MGVQHVVAQPCTRCGTGLDAGVHYCRTCGLPPNWLSESTPVEPASEPRTPAQGGGAEAKVSSGPARAPRLWTVVGLGLGLTVIALALVVVLTLNSLDLL